MSHRVTITMDFEDEQDAVVGMAAMEEAGAKYDGDLQDSDVEDLDAA